MKHRLTAMLTAATALPVQAQGGDLTSTIRWELDDNGTLTVSGSGDMPDDYTHSYNARKLPPWENRVGEIQHVSIGKGIASIGPMTFYAYSSQEPHTAAPSFTSAEIASSVKSIGLQAFAFCKALESIDLPGVESIGDDAFMECSGLNSVKFSNQLSEIKSSAFRGCTSLKEIDLSRTSLQSLETGAFAGCTGAETLSLPPFLHRITDGTFSGCENLKSIFFYETTNNGRIIGVVEIGKDSFNGCSALKELTFPDSLEAINDSAFSGCTALEQVSLGRSTYYIGKLAFSETNLKNAVLPKTGMTSAIQEDAFFCCPSLEYVAIKDPLCVIADSPGTICNTGEYHYNWENGGACTVENCTYTGAIVGFTGSTAEAYANKYGYTFVSYGSINDEPEINASDAAAILVVSAKIGGGSDSGQTAVQREAADVNGDGSVNATDAAIILQYAAAAGAGQKDISLADFVRI